LSGTVVG